MGLQFFQERQAELFFFEYVLWVKRFFFNILPRLVLDLLDYFLTFIFFNFFFPLPSILFLYIFMLLFFCRFLLNFFNVLILRILLFGFQNLFFGFILIVLSGEICLVNFICFLWCPYSLFIRDLKAF